MAPRYSSRLDQANVGSNPTGATRGDGAPREVKMVTVAIVSFICGMFCGAMLLMVVALCVVSGDEAQRQEDAGLGRRS